MKIITRKNDGVALYAANTLNLDETQATGNGWRDPNHTTANATIHEGVTLPPDWLGGSYSYLDGVWTVVDPIAQAAKIAAELQAAIEAAKNKINADADKIYGDVVGNKGEEYRSAEADAKAFIAALYTGTAGGGVTSWATAKGWTNTQAAADIITQATAWRGAQAAIRANRLVRKEAVKAAVDLTALNTAMAQWAGFAAAIRGQLGV